MRIIFLLVLVVGMGLAGYAAFMIMQQFEGYQAQIVSLNNDLRQSKANEIEVTTVIVAAEELKFGAELLEENVKEVPWPATDVPPNAFTSLEDLLGGENVDPRYIVRPMEIGEPILSTKVTDFGEDAGLRSRLRPGMRAFTIEVNVASGVSGFLQPGDLVDVYWTGGGRDIAQKVTKLILEGVTLMAIDQTSSEDISRPSVAKTVTLEVSPQVVAKLVQAQQTGKLTLALRGTQDVSLVGEIQVDQNDINPIENNEIPEERHCFRSERRAGELTQIEVPCPEN